jgi:F-type H+-transporting ATPase subunit epsilon
MANEFTLKIFEPAGLILEAKVAQVTLVTVDGEITVLPGHVEYVGVLGVGVLRYEGVTGQGRTQGKVVVTGGACNFANEVLTVLADTVDLPENVDRANLGKDKTQLEQLVATGSSLDPAWDRAQARLKRIEAVQALIQ